MEVKKINTFLEKYNTIAVLCNQWGDTGKGKFIDLFSHWADIVARGTGGANAGHTINIAGKEFCFHLLPSGLLHKNKINIVGNGVAFDPRVAKEELEILKKETNNEFGKLMIAYNAKLMLPTHILLDRLNASGAKGVGTTGRGIGPMYQDHTARTGLIVNDMLNKETFERKFIRNLENKMPILKSYDKKIIKEILNHEHLGSGIYYDEENIINIKRVVEEYMKYGEMFKHQISDTDKFLRDNKKTKKILLEGAQGFLLSIDYGAQPFVTCSDPSIEGLSKGVGLKEEDVDKTFGLEKAFYMTRVGEGPFPTEMGGEKSSIWCREKTKHEEQTKYPNVTVNDEDEFLQGIAIRKEGFEYGATTGRPRRTGWLDLPLIRYAKIINGKDIVLTKVDVLKDCNKIKICYSYTYDGDEYFYGGKILKKGDILTLAPNDQYVLSKCKPNYKEFKGWNKDIRNIKEYENLPKEIKEIIEYIEIECDVNVVIVSVGPKREDTIYRS